MHIIANPESSSSDTASKLIEWLCKVCHDFAGEEVEAFTRDGIWEKDEEIVDPIVYIF